MGRAGSQAASQQRQAAVSAQRGQSHAVHLNTGVCPFTVPRHAQHFQMRHVLSLEPAFQYKVSHPDAHTHHHPASTSHKPAHTHTHL